MVAPIHTPSCVPMESPDDRDVRQDSVMSFSSTARKTRSLVSNKFCSGIEHGVRDTSTSVMDNASSTTFPIGARNSSDSLAQRTQGNNFKQCLKKTVILFDLYIYILICT